MKKLYFALVAMLVAFAASAGTVKFDNSVKNWDKVLAYYWGGDAPSVTWPGTEMTQGADGLWTITISGTPENIIFNNGNGEQTEDLTYVEDATYNYYGNVADYDPDGHSLCIAGEFNDWSRTANKSTTVVNNCVEVSVSNWAGGKFKFVLDGSWYGNGKEVALGDWASDMSNQSDPNGTLNMTLPASADGKNLLFTVALDSHDLKVEIVGEGGGNQGGGDDPVTPPTPGEFPATIYMMGNVNGFAWNPTKGLAATGANGVYTWSDVTIDGTAGYINFGTVLSTGAGETEDQWGEVNSGDRYGAVEKDAPLAAGQSATVALYQAGVNASATESWTIAGGSYNVKLDLNTMTITLTAGEGGGSQGGGDDPVTPPTPGEFPATIYMMGNVNGFDWNPTKGLAATGANGVYTWSDVTIDGTAGYINFGTVLATSTEGTTDELWGEVNSGNRYGAPEKDTPLAAGQSATVALYQAGVNASATESWMIAGGNYSVKLDLNTMTITLTAGEGGGSQGGGDDPVNPPTPGEYPSVLYLIGNVNGFAWDPSKGVEATSNSGVFTYNDITIDDGNEGYGYFSFATVLSSGIGDSEEQWGEVNSGDRYGAPAPDTVAQGGGSYSITLYPVNVSASAAASWMIPAGEYNFVVNLSTMQLDVTGKSGIEAIGADSAAPAVYYNLQGVRVANPTGGIYIRVQGGKTSKVLVK